MAIFSPAKKTLDYNGGTFKLSLALGATETDAKSWYIEYYNAAEKSYVVTITSTGATYCDMTVAALANNSTVDLNHIFYVVRVPVNAVPVRHRYSFTVQHNPEKVIKPIWQDVECYSDSLNLEYTIYNEDGDVMYKGKAVAEPNNDRTVININKICSNYLSNSLVNGVNNGFEYNYDFVKLFTVKEKSTTASSEKPIAQYRFYNSYAYGEEPTFIFNSDPIRRKIDNNGNINIDIDRRQYLMYSAFNKNTTAKTLTLRYIRGGQINDGITLGLDNTAELIYYSNNLYSDDTYVTGVIVNTDDINDGVLNAHIKDSCYDYCLYYCNAFGGWDSLLVDGNVKKVDKIESKYYNKAFNNTRQDFEKKKFANVITPQYTLHTGWFNDDEQSRLHHLLESTEVYLHNLNTDEVIPVNITNNSCEYKTFTNNGKKKFNNTINVEVAQTKVRRV